MGNAEAKAEAEARFRARLAERGVILLEPYQAAITRTGQGARPGTSAPHARSLLYDHEYSVIKDYDLRGSPR
jgi:hypothetical protein